MSARENAAMPRWSDERQLWIYRVQDNGIRKIFYSSKRGRAGAKEVKAKYQKYLAREQILDDPKIKEVWGAYIDDVTDRKGENSNSERTASQIGGAYILPKIGNMRVSKVKEQDLQRLLNKVRGQQGQRLAKKTVSNIRAEIKLFFKFLKKSGYINWLPDTLEVPDYLEAQEKNIWQREEVRHLLMDTRLEPYIMAWQMIVLYGFRPGEVYSMQWRDITKDQIMIRRSLNAQNEITGGKNKNARRTEYLLDEAKKVLQRAKQYQQSIGRISNFVFCNADGEHLNTKVSARKLHAYCTKYNLTDITPYRLRHTFASLAKAALNELQLKKILGHSDKMDTNLYIHTLNDDYIQSGKALNELYSEVLTK